MNIFITLKSVLNYLYNNLIDLIWTKKIKFADGTEQTTAGNSGGSFSLFDIKTISQAVAEKGFAFMCKSSRVDFSKNTLPTLYNSILNKYINADESLSPLNQGVDLSVSLTKAVCFSSKNNVWYIIKDYKIYSTIDFINLTLVDDSQQYLNICCGNNVLIAKYQDNLDIKTKIFELTDLSINKSISYNFNVNRSFIIDNSVIIFDQSNRSLYKINDDYNTADEFITLLTGIFDIYKYSNNFYILYNNKLMVGSNINDINSFTEILTDNLIQYGGGFVVADEHFVAYCSTRGYPIKYSYDDFDTYNSTSNVDIGDDDTLRFMPVIWKNNLYYPNITDVGIGTTEVRYRQINNFSNSVNLGVGFGSNYKIVVSSNDKNIVFSSQYLYYIGTIKTVFTDKYEINGNIVSIDYVKNNDFKICLADNGTNDTNLETVLNFMGYYNYFRLDTVNETVSLPRNLNLYTQMFVNDNFIDTLDNISGNATRLLPQADNIFIDNASISIDLKENTNYKFTNNNITDITLSSCQDSPLDIYIKFTTGNSVPTLTDNSGIVWADGQPVLEANKTYVIVIVDKTAYYKEF